MNIYFLVEGRRTERKIYPQWLSVLTPGLERVEFVADATANNYFLFSGEGYPSLLRHLQNAVADVNTIGAYDYLVVCLDAEETSVEERKASISQYLSEAGVELKQAELVVVVQNPCFETWFLGNRKIFKRNPQSQLLKDYIAFYNVQQQDPELMPTYVENTRAQFHAAYLREIFAERNIAYTKQHPGEVGTESFLRELIKRNEETGHIASFKELLDFCQSIKTLSLENI